MATTFNSFTTNRLSFTNIRVTEADTGLVLPFLGVGATPSGAVSGTGAAFNWLGVNTGVYYANSTEVLNIDYTVTDTSGDTLIDSMGQYYQTDFQSGNGISLTAVQSAYTTSGLLVGTDTYSLGSGPASAQFAVAQTTINVHVTLTLAIGSAGNNLSALLVSQLQNTFGTIATAATGSIGDIVFNDFAGTGLETGFNAGPGIAGVTVELLNGDGTAVLGITTTDANGLYDFSGLTAGVYEIQFFAPTGYGFSQQGVGTDSSINSSANQMTGITRPITVHAGQAIHNVEAGLVAGGSAGGSSGSIGNTVWFDSNGDGLLNNGESGVGGVTVDLLDGTGLFIAETTTDSSGSYQFANLAAGTYEVQVVAPAADGFTIQNAATDGSFANSAVNASGLTSVITLTEGQIDNSVDAGLTRPASLGSTVWLDADYDGLLDNGETGVAGVTVELLNADGTSILATTTTNANGAYSFTGLGAGVYEVAFVAPTGDMFAARGVGTDPTVNSSADTGTGITGPVTLTGGQNGTGVNAGLQFKLASLGSTVFLDTNRDGLLDNGETGVAGVTVELLNAAGTSILATTTTDSNGTYAFTGLTQGAYEVEFVAPTDSVFTTRGVGTNPAINSSASAITGITAPVTLTAGQNNMNVNAGLQIAPASLGSMVFLDTNRDGLLDNGETGVAGVTVELLNATGTSILAITTTNASGGYAFTNLNTGTYQVEFIAPNGDIFTTQGVGTNPAVNSSADASTGITAAITLTAGQNVATVNAGLQIAPASLGSMVFLDANHNGLFDTGETGVAGVTVELLDGAGTSVLAITTTNSSGTYAFTGLNAGVYEVEFIAPSGDTFTTRGVGANPAINSSANQTTGITAPITLTAGEINNNADAGLVVVPVTTASIGNTVWLDTNHDGLDNNGEAGVAGVTVELLNATGTSILAVTTTDAAGTYQFANLAAGTYEVQILAPTGDGFTNQNVATTGTIKNSAVNGSGLTSAIMLTAGQINNNVNAGLTLAPASLGSKVWLDADRNGLLDAGEIGVAGVTVELLNAAGTSILAVTTTNASGTYAFTGIDPGAYEVAFIAPTGDILTTGGVGTNAAINSSADATTGVTTPITLTAGQNNPNVNAGLQLKPASLGSTVFLDTNRDGLFGTGETGIAGVTVELLNATGTSILAITTTNASGGYAFNNLNPDTYEVAFIAPTGDIFTTKGVGTNAAVNSSANATTGITGPVTLTAGQNIPTVNAGLQIKPASLGSTVFFDANRDGLLDNGETGLAGVTVQLLNGAGTSVLATTTTNASGTYSFNTLNPGTYEVKFLAPSGDVFTAQGVGTNAAINSSANAGTGISAPITLAAGQNNPNINAGLKTAPASIGNFVWLDTNKDGLQNNGEAGVAGVTVQLLNGTGTSILATTTTSSTGGYNFSDLNAGVYEVKFLAPAGDTFTTQGVGTNGAVNSSANANTGVTAPITLGAGQTNNNIDAGLKNTSSLSVLKLPSTMVVNQCGQVTYTFSVTNTGSTALTNVKIQDNIGTAANPDYVTPTLVTTGTNGVLGAGQTWLYTETVSQIASANGNSGSINHTATGGNLTAGCTAWLHSSFKPTSYEDGTKYKFQGVKCSISGGGVASKPISVDFPDSEVRFSKDCTRATTVYNSSTNTWVTTLPANYDPGSVFLTGCPVKVPTGSDLSNANVTWTIDDSSNSSGASKLTWGAGVTGYQSFNQNGYDGGGDYNQIGVKSCDNQNGYGNGGSTETGYRYTRSNNSDGSGDQGSSDNSRVWQGSGSDKGGTPENQYTSNNCDGSRQSSGGDDNGSGSASQNTANVAGAADTVTVTARAVAGTNCGTATTTAAGSYLTSGCTAWLHSTFKPISCSDGASYSFKGVTCSITGTGAPTLNIKCPDSIITFSKSCTTATTVFNAATNCWITTLPADSKPGNVFLTGCPQIIASGSDLTNAKVTWSIGSSSNNCGASNLNWNGGVTGYNSFNQGNFNGISDYNQIGVKSSDTFTANGDSSNSAGTPTREYSASNSGDTRSSTTRDDNTNNCGSTQTTSPGITVTATDTKEVQVLGSNSNISVGGIATTASLSATYGAAKTLEFTYNPGNTVSLKQVQAGLGVVAGTNSNTLAFMEISNNANWAMSGASIYFQGAVTSGEKIFADATLNVLTNTPIAGGHFSNTAGADIFAFVFTSQAAFLAGAAPVQTMAYNTSGSQAMHFGDTIGSLSVIGYVGATGGRLVA